MGETREVDLSKLHEYKAENGFCIILSKYRVYQGVALCRSIAKNIRNRESYKIFILCMDQDTYSILSHLNLANVILVKLSTVETKELLLVKDRRKLNEYCWTLKPVFLKFILKNCPYVKRITQLDADLYFFNDPSPIFINQSNSSVLLSEHDFPEHAKGNEFAAGKTNSGIVSFKRDQYAYYCLKWWKKQCLAWCYDRVEGNRFSDQRYLDQAPILFDNVSYINTPGVNIAPWNEMKYTVTERNGELYVNENKLILYHFCGLRIRNKNEYSLILEKKEPIPVIYEPYLKAVLEVISEIESIDPTFNGFQIEERFKDIEKIHKISSSEVTSQENESKEPLVESKYCFATLVSDKYLYKSIVMYRSLVKYCKDFHLYMLCIDQKVYKIINEMDLDSVTCIPLAQVENTELLKAKNNRSVLEYCWTLKPAFLHYVMTNFPFYKYYTLVDSDLYFFDKPTRLFKEALGELFYLTDHNNSENYMHLYDETGRINSGFVGCKNDDITLEAVGWWKNRCIEWCYVHCDRDAKLYADQRYLERWDSMFPRVHVIESKGANVATWNIEGYDISQREDIPYINDERIIFYHFSGLSIFNSKEFNLTWFRRLDDKVVEYIYMPYLREIAQVISEIEEMYPDFSEGFTDKYTNPVHYLEI